MQLHCKRYVYDYQSSPEEVEDFIRRSADLAEKTYGRDAHFSRLNQVLEQARFLGWDIPRFGQHIPEIFTEIPLIGVNHIFEHQAKLIVDVAPVTRVTLENGRFFPVRMVCGTTAAGDLVWRCHLLLDRDGCPYVTRKGKTHRVRTKGTKIVCQSESTPYDEKHLFECFGGDKDGVWPVPFLPEFFSDQPITHAFQPEPGLLEVITIYEPNPVHVFAQELVPWYRPLKVDRSKALTMGGFEEDEESPDNIDVNSLVSGWDDLADNETIPYAQNPDRSDSDDSEDEEDEEDEEDGEGSDGDFDDDLPIVTNVLVSLSEQDAASLKEATDFIAQSGISSRDEAEQLKQDQTKAAEAESWLNAQKARRSLLSFSGAKLGAILSILESHPDQQALLVQPGKKAVSALVSSLRSHNVSAELVTPQNLKAQLRKFDAGKAQVLVVSEPVEDLFLDGIVIISVSAFAEIHWLEWLQSSHVLYTLAVDEDDLNYIPECSDLEVNSAPYDGPVVDIQKPAPVAPKAPPKPPNEEQKAKPDSKPKTAKKPRFRVVVGDKTKTAPSYQKALEIVKKAEQKKIKCEVYGPESTEALYITGIGELT